MPHFTFSLSRDGLAVHGLVGLNDVDTAALVQAGQPIPRTTSVRALLDTACDITSVSGRVLQPSGLVCINSTTTQTVGGQVSVDLYQVSLSVYGPTMAPSPLLVFRNLLVMEMVEVLQNVDVLIGLDILNECLLIHNGPGRQFILGF